MSRPRGIDPQSKIGRSLFQLIDASMKMPVAIRERVARVRNLLDSDPDDPMVRFKIGPDLDALMKESRLNPVVRALRKAIGS